MGTLFFFPGPLIAFKICFWKFSFVIIQVCLFLVNFLVLSHHCFSLFFITLEVLLGFYSSCFFVCVWCRFSLATFADDPSQWLVSLVFYLDYFFEKEFCLFP